MKKVFAILLAIVCSFVIGCGNASDSGNKSATKSTKDVENIAKDTYQYLVAADELTDAMMAAVLRAWYFPIDHSDGFTNSQYAYACASFATEVGVSNVDASVKNMIKGTITEKMNMEYSVFNDISYCVILIIHW